MSTGVDTLNDALQRAKELTGPGINTLKRPTNSDDSFPAKRANMDMQSISTIGGMGGPGMGMAGFGGGGPMAMGVNPNENVVEVITVPENAVGLVIGKGGTEISQIQTQSGARVQMAPNGDGNGIRQCTLQGLKYSVDRAKQMIHEVINRHAARKSGGVLFNGDAPPSGNNTITYDMLIPGTKCGLVIGKAGDTIRQLQEQSGVKMVMIQDNTDAGLHSKPLRMTGDPERIEAAKKLVQDLLNSRNDDGGLIGGAPNPLGGGGGGGGGMNSYGGGGNSYGNASAGQGLAKGEVVVPRASVGMIIGKAGDTIKRLAMDTGTKIQFKPDDPSVTDRCAVITGTREQIYKATELITELVQKSCAQAGPQVQETFYMHVPANKTGLVIGKGGETIKQICTEAGAHVELSRDPPPNVSEKVFIIKGTQYQIHHATHIIRIKVGDIPPGTPVPAFAGSGGPTFSAQAAFGGAPAAQFQMPGQQGAPWNQFAGQQDQRSAQPQGMPQQFYGGAAAQPAQAPMQQFALQQQGGGYAAQAAQQPAFNGAGAGAAAPAAGAPAAAATAAPVINPTTGQADYSAQWAEYYRSMGMVDQAQKIEQQMMATRANGAAAVPVQQVQYANAGQFQGQAF